MNCILKANQVMGGIRLTAEQASLNIWVLNGAKAQVFIQIKQLLAPLSIQKFCTDGWGADDICYRE